ncbi:Uncharacterised protein [Mycobacteroides abscessus subsp. massiliense]|nr:Uncharacterised protein [Mycobacteroides abscessus subsp. massiliense]
MGHSTIASGAREDECDRRQQTILVESGDHLGARRRAVQRGRPGSALLRSAPPRPIEVGKTIGLTALRDVAREIRVDLRRISRSA